MFLFGLENKTLASAPFQRALFVGSGSRPLACRPVHPAFSVVRPACAVGAYRSSIYARTSSGELRELRVLVLTARTLKWYRVFGDSPATSHPFARPLKDATEVIAAETGVAAAGTVGAPPVEETPPPWPLLFVPRVEAVPATAAISRRLPATPSSRKSTNLWRGVFWAGGRAGGDYGKGSGTKGRVGQKSPALRTRWTLSVISVCEMRSNVVALVSRVQHETLPRHHNDATWTSTVSRTVFKNHRKNSSDGDEDGKAPTMLGALVPNPPPPLLSLTWWPGPKPTTPRSPRKRARRRCRHRPRGRALWMPLAGVPPWPLPRGPPADYPAAKRQRSAWADRPRETNGGRKCGENACF